jgi:hypothetical protein
MLSRVGNPAQWIRRKLGDTSLLLHFWPTTLALNNAAGPAGMARRLNEQFVAAFGDAAQWEVSVDSDPQKPVYYSWRRLVPSRPRRFIFHYYNLHLQTKQQKFVDRSANGMVIIPEAGLSDFLLERGRAN